MELAGMEARLVREIQQPGDEIFVQVQFVGDWGSTGISTAHCFASGGVTIRAG